MALKMNLQTRNIVAASSGTSAEDDVFMNPIPHQPTIKEGHCIENESNSSPPSGLSVPVCPPIRICGFDEEEEEDNVVLELGCSCRGEMSRMHRKCILKWYGVRMLLEKLYTCELCNTALHINAQLIVARGVTDHRNGGRAILMNALKSSLASYAPHIEVERAANCGELLQLLLDENAEWYRHRGQVVAHIEAAQAADSNPQEEEAAPIPVPPACGRGALIVSIGATVVSVGLYAYILVHLYGN